MFEKFPSHKRQRLETIIPIAKTRRAQIIIDSLFQIAKKQEREQITIIEDPKIVDVVRESGIPVREIDGKLYADFSDVYDPRKEEELPSAFQAANAPTLTDVVEEQMATGGSRPQENERADTPIASAQGTPVMPEGALAVELKNEAGLHSESPGNPSAPEDVDGGGGMTDKSGQTPAGKTAPPTDLSTIPTLTDEIPTLTDEIPTLTDEIPTLTEEVTPEEIARYAARSKQVSSPTPETTTVSESGDGHPLRPRAPESSDDERGRKVLEAALTKAIIRARTQLDAMRARTSEASDNPEVAPPPRTEGTARRGESEAAANISLELQPLDARLIREIENLRDQEDHENFYAGLLLLLHRAGFTFTERDIFSENGIFYLQAALQGEEFVITPSEAVGYLREMAEKSKALYAEEEREAAVLKKSIQKDRDAAMTKRAANGETMGSTPKAISASQQNPATENASPSAVTGGGQVRGGGPPGRKKPHLNNAQSRAYLASVEELRSRERAKKTPVSSREEQAASDPFWEAVHGQVSQEYLGEKDVPPKGADAFWSAVEEQVAPEFKDAGTLESLTMTKPSEEPSPVDIELPLSQSTVDIELPMTPTRGREEESARTQNEQAEETNASPRFESILSDIAFLERAKSEVSYGSREFESFVMARDPVFIKTWRQLGGGRDAATIMWIDQKLRELRSEKREAELTAALFFDERFEKEFGISKSELLHIPGFEKLSNGQQMLVYENLREYVENESQGQAGAMWDAIKKYALGMQLDERPEKKAAGIDAYRDFLTKNIYTMATHGPRVHVENGELMTDFIGMAYDREHRKEQKRVCDALNSAAHAFARIPASWQEDGNGVRAKEWALTSFVKEKVLRTESRTQYREFEAKQNAYEEAKRKFAQQLEATGVPKEQIVRKLVELDGQIHQMRFIETNPEASALVRSIPDQSFWEKVGMTMKAGAVYAGMGSLARAATADALKVLSGPLVAASFAGIRSWNRTAAEQRERDRKARLGVGDTTSTALNIVPASQIVETREGRIDMGATAKLKRQLNEYHTLSPDTDSKERIRIISQLRARVLYTEDKYQLNRIQFGDKENFAVNQARFLETLASAKVLLANEDLSSPDTLEKRLEKYLEYREGAINDRRHREQLRKAAVASTAAAATAVAGAYAMHEFLESETGQKAASKVKEWFASQKFELPSQRELENTGSAPVIERPIPPPPPEIPPTASYSHEHLRSPQESMGDAIDGGRVDEATIPEAATAEEKEEIQKLFTEEKPTPPTPAERAEIQKLFAESGASPQRSGENVQFKDGLSHKAVFEQIYTPPGRGEVMPGIDAMNTTPGKVLEGHYVQNYLSSRRVPPYDWVTARDKSADAFVLDAMERGSYAYRNPALRELGKVFQEIQQPPYNVALRRGETTEVFLKRVFSVLKQAHDQGTNTENMREFLREISTPRTPR